jgi:hypothetical protein
MSFSKSINRINEIKFDKIVNKKPKSLNKKSCSNCFYYHGPTKHCDFLYKDVPKDHLCSAFFKNHTK